MLKIFEADVARQTMAYLVHAAQLGVAGATMRSMGHGCWQVSGHSHERNDYL